MTTRDFETRTVRTYELYGDFWLNSEPVPIAALRGQMILMHFWDFTCVHSRRTLPYLKEWFRKYEPFRLVVVGVHTPKFAFARKPEAVQKAVDELGITYPIVMDNDHLIASSYGNRVGPPPISSTKMDSSGI
jgi:thiol-disulfide isomerase/thioredoxin